MSIINWTISAFLSGSSSGRCEPLSRPVHRLPWKTYFNYHEREQLQIGNFKNLQFEVPLTCIVAQPPHPSTKLFSIQSCSALHSHHGTFSQILLAQSLSTYHVNRTPALAISGCLPCDAPQLPATCTAAMTPKNHLLTKPTERNLPFITELEVLKVLLARLVLSSLLHSFV